SGTPRKYILLLILIAPFLTSYLLRVLAWKVILGSQGVVNTFLFWTGIRSPDNPISQLLYSRFAVMLVLAYIWLPFVALPIFVALENLDVRLLEAASDLGATRLQAFVRVTLPLSAPGVVAAFLFIFIPTVAAIVFLYAPIAILLVFSFNDSVLPTFPLSGFTLNWYRQFVHDPELRGALETSALVAALSSVGAVALGTLASLALARRRFHGKA